MLPNDDMILDETQTLRRKIVEDLTPNGEMPNDPKQTVLLLQTLDSMDRQALTKKRLRVDGENADKAAAAELIAASIMAKYGTIPPDRAIGARTAPVDLPTSISATPSTVPGQTFIGLETDDYDSFMSRAKA